MRAVLALGMALVAGSVWAREGVIPKVNYPVVAAEAVSGAGFVPKGWALESQAAGDLNGDGLPDLVLVMLDQDPHNVVSFDGGDSLDTNPRLLVVALAKKGGGYTRALQNHTLIERHEESNIDDPLQEPPTLSHGVFRVKLHFWASAGSWSGSERQFTFRYEGGCFRLIGYDYDHMMRDTQDTEVISINYLSGKVKQVSGNDQTGKSHTKWSVLPKQGPLCLDQIGDGLIFDPTV